MKRIWTIESAKAYVVFAETLGKRGLKYCSAVDFLRKHGIQPEQK